MTNRPVIDLEDDDFGAILNCAVRYAIGRRTYMPHLVIGFIQPLLPYINSKTLYVFDRDITEQGYFGGFGDPQIDEPSWMRFWAAVHEELDRRGEERYKDWRKAGQ